MFDICRTTSVPALGEHAQNTSGYSNVASSPIVVHNDMVMAMMKMKMKMKINMKTR